MSKPRARSDTKSKLEPTRTSATAKVPQIRKSPDPTSPSPPWVPIVGVVFLGLAVLFFMALAVASMKGFIVPDTERWLIFIVLALSASTGSGFLGGSAAASGKISVPTLSPVKFGVTGGVAVFIITLILCNALFNPKQSPGPPAPRAPEITKVDASSSGGLLNVNVEFSPANPSLQGNDLYAEIATDKEFTQFTHRAEKSANFCIGRPLPCLITFSKQQGPQLWLRFVVKTSEGKVVAASKEFKIP